MMLTDLAEVVRSAGFTVIECKGWKTRGHGGMSDIRTITPHHTAGPKKGNAPSLDTVENGRPGLSGPLAQLLLARDSTVYVVAAGLCYHAGVSRHVDYTNPHAIGIEAEATGVGEWDGAPIDDYARLTGALKHHYGAAHILGHKETCYPVGRKSDPLLDMDKLRKLSKDWDMPTPEQIANAVWDHRIANQNLDNPDTNSKVSHIVTNIEFAQDSQFRQLNDKIDKLITLLTPKATK